MKCITESVISSKEQTTTRDRECFMCSVKIKKGEKYILHWFRYDKKRPSIYLHKKCFNQLNIIIENVTSCKR